jgi:peptide subunit release factor 1 (eRF1)
MVNDVTPERLRRLVEPRENGAVLSLYLDLDPTQLPTPPAREAAVDSLLHEARRCLEDHELDHDSRVHLRAALGELEAQLRPSSGMTAEGARGLAAFAIAGNGGIEVLRLPAPVRTHVVLDRGAHVEPLVPLAAQERWCVALINRDTARFHLGDEHEMRLSGKIQDDVHGQHDQGGWSQRNYQESIEQEVLHHLDRVAHTLQVALTERDLYDRLLLGGPQEMRKLIEARLHPFVRERLYGWIDIDLSSATVDDVRRAAAQQIVAIRRDHEREVLDRLQAAIGSGGGRGVHGVEDVLLVLHERRVETLLVNGDLHRPGKRCPSCGLLTTSGETCPADDTELQTLEDVVDAAVAAAIEQDAEVLVMADEPRLQTLGSIAAVLRF